MKNAVKDTCIISDATNEIDYNLLVDTTILLGEILLKNGAETNRVEHAMDKLLRTTQMKHIETVVMTTSIIVTLSDPSIEHITAVSRIHERITNFNKVDMTYRLLNQYCNKEITLEKFFKELKNVKQSKSQYSNLLHDVGLILVPPAFTLMLNGTYIDALISLLCGFILVMFDKLFDFIHINEFMKKVILISITSFIASIVSKYANTNVQAIIIGFIMPYVPGIAITNATRDTFNEDYMSGAARILGAFVKAISVALGVYLGLYISNIIF